MTALYVDSSALLKRLFKEDGSDTVRTLLAARTAQGDLVVASELAWLEVARVVRRTGVADVGGSVSRALSGVARQRLDSSVLERAHNIGPGSLRTLDAIHLAAAVIAGATQLLTFDERLAAAAESVGVRAIP